MFDDLDPRVQQDRRYVHQSRVKFSLPRCFLPLRACYRGCRHHRQRAQQSTRTGTIWRLCIPCCSVTSPPDSVWPSTSTTA
jgi:hypothetical protein